MEHNILYAEENATFPYPASRQKGVVATSGTAVLVGYGLVIALAKLIDPSTASYAAPIVFLAAGVAFVAVAAKHRYHLPASKRLALPAVLALAIFVLLLSSAIWDAPFSFSMTLAAVCAFLLPVTVAELWQLHAQISLEGAQPWESSNGLQLSNNPAIYLNGIPVNFSVIQEPEDKALEMIPFLASGQMPLCDVFCDMASKRIKNGQPPVAFSSREQEPYTWVFFTSDWYIWNRALDPTQSLVRNGIKPNTVIYAQRVSKEQYNLKSSQPE